MKNSPVSVFFSLFIIPCLFTLYTSPRAFSQTHFQAEQLFMEAESWFYFQDYKNSLPLYLQIHENFPQNDNVNYKIGICYLNIVGEKQKAISFLEEAAQNVTFRYSEEAFYEKRAPVDAIFYLGNAYLKNNQLNKALTTYNRFERKIEDKPKLLLRNVNYDLEFLENQKEVCRRAKKMMTNPVGFTAINLGVPVNTPQSEYNPVVSGDGKTLIFTAEKKFYTGVFMSQKKNGQWQIPVNLLPQLGIDGDCETTSISYDGKELYLYREDDLDGNLYVSHFKDGLWSKIKKLGENINTEYWESHAYISPDGQKLYFTSNREGGYGGLDIYVSQRKDDQSWGKPQNLGDTINTKWQEDTPFLTADGKKLFFSSEGHQNMGGFDIFLSEKTSGGWSEPKNMGYPINTTDDDRFFVPLNDGAEALYAVYHNNSPGKKDIFRYNIDFLNKIDYIDVEGILTYESPQQKNKKTFHINIINKLSNDTLAQIKPDSQQTQYNYTFNKINNHLIFETPSLTGKGQYIISKKLEIKEQYLTSSEEPGKKKEKPETTQKKPQIDLDRNVFEVSSDQDHVKIKMKLKSGNRLIVSTFKKDKLLNTEEFTVDQEEFLYQYETGQGETEIRFKLMDKNNNIQTKTIDIRIDSVKTAKDPVKLAEKNKMDSAQLEIGDKSFTLTGGKKKVNIKLSLEKGSKLIVSTYVGKKLINKEQFNIEKEQFTYEFEPRNEKNRINFMVVDSNRNVSNKQIVISHKPIKRELEEMLSSADSFKGEAIQSYISKYDPHLFNLEQFINELKTDNLKAPLTEKDRKILLYSLILLGDDSPTPFHNDLLELSDGEIKQYLEGLDLSSLDSKKQLMKKLLTAASKNEWTSNQMNNLWMDYLQTKYPREELYSITRDISSLHLNKILEGLNASAVDIVSADDLLRYLTKHKKKESPEIIAILKAIELSEIMLKPQKESPDKDKPEKEKPEQPGRNYYIPGIAGLVVLVTLILLLTRRKKHRKKKDANMN